MSVISVCSTKGGAGKTTLTLCLADAFARQGGSVCIIDADPNRHVFAWRERAPDSTVDVIDGASEATIFDRITEAARRYSLVFVDLEGTANQTTTYAIAESDVVVIPSKISGMDRQETFRTHDFVRRAEKMLRRPIEARVVLTMLSPLRTNLADHAREEIQGAGIPVLKTEILNRVAYQEIHNTGETPAAAEGDAKARAEISGVLEELLSILAQQQQQAAE